MGKGVFNCFFSRKSILWAGWELNKIIESKRIYIATTGQPKLIVLY